MKKIIILFILCNCFFLIACCGSDKTNNKDAKANKVENSINSSKDEKTSNNEVDYNQLRKKANTAEAASAVGYDGKAIKKELNKLIDQKEKMDKNYKDLDL